MSYIQNFNFLSVDSYDNCDIICTIENEETLELQNFHIYKDKVIDAMDKYGIENFSILDFEAGEYDTACEEIFEDFKKCDNADDFYGAYIQSKKKPCIVFEIPSKVSQQYIISDKGQSDEQLQEMCSKIGATSFKRAVQ